jgi:hypothetical protein
MFMAISKGKEVLTLDYKKALNNHMRNNVEDAVSSFIQGDVGHVLTLFPQALNPFLKALESMSAWKKAVVIPYSDFKGKPLYIVLKIDGERDISSISL